MAELVFDFLFKNNFCLIFVLNETIMFCFLARWRA